MLKSRLFGSTAILAAVVVLSLAACDTGGGNSSRNDGKKPSYPARYQVVPGWTTQGENTIAVSREASAARAAEDDTGYLPVVYSEHKGGYDHYLIYLGHIDNVPIGKLTASADYDGTTPITITRTSADITETTVGTSISTAVSETTTSTTVKNRTASAGAGINWGPFSIGAEARTKTTITNSTTKELSVENTTTSATSKAQASTEGFGYSIGNNGEPAGRYRVVLFATTDVYLYIKTDENNELVEGFTPEISICAREASYTYKLDYTPTTDGDFPRTGGGGMLPIPDDFSSLTKPPRYYRFTAVGISGQTAYSNDGKNWQQVALGYTGNWNGVASGNNNRFVAVGAYASASKFNMALSANGGAGWEAFLTQTGSNNPNWNKVMYVKDTWITTGSYTTTVKYGTISQTTTTDVRMYSPDGGSGSWKTFPSAALNDFAYGYDRWVSVGASGKITYATTLTGSWTSKTVGSANWNGVTYGNNRFVAVGNAGNVAYSHNGSDWTSKKVGAAAWNRVHYNYEKFVAVSTTVTGGLGKMAYSTDGIDWTEITVGTAIWRDVTYGNGVWVAVGGTSDKIGKIAWSEDGVNWTEQTMGEPGSSNWNGVAFGAY